MDLEDIKPKLWTKAEWNLGRWLSAALDDDHACQEFKDDIDAWFKELGERLG
jgi:hypothetical protein